MEETKSQSTENLSKGKTSHAENSSASSTGLKDNKNKDTVKSNPDKQGQASAGGKTELTVIIRISGMVKVKPEIKNTLERLKLLRK